MKKIVTVAVVAAGALALSACGAKEEEAPAEAAETEMMPAAEEAPVTEEEAPAATDDAAANAEGVDENGNPIVLD